MCMQVERKQILVSQEVTPPPTPPTPTLAAADYPEAIHVNRSKTATKLEIWCDVVSIL